MTKPNDTLNVHESPAVREITTAVQALLDRLVIIVQREAFQEAERIAAESAEHQAACDVLYPYD